MMKGQDNYLKMMVEATRLLNDYKTSFRIQ